MKLIGTCEIKRPGLPERTSIEFDLMAQTISLWLPLPDIKRYFTAGQELSGKHLPIKNIQVVSPSGILSCRQIPPSFVSSFNSAGWSLDDGEINKVVTLDDHSVPGMRLCLTLRRSTMTFTVAPFADSASLSPETMFTNHGHHWHSQFGIRIGKRVLDVRYSPKYVFVRGRTTEDDREVLRYVCSALSLGPEQVVAQLAPPKLTIDYSWSTTRAYGEALVKADHLPRTFQTLVQHLTSCAQDERQRRFSEIIHLVGGFQQSLYVENRLTNLFKALESFDGTRRMDANHLSGLLRIKRGDADFVCGVRNSMFHRAMPLLDAARKTHAELSSRHVPMERFAHVTTSNDLPWRLYVTLARLIVPAFFRSCGIAETEVLFAKMKGF